MIYLTLSFYQPAPVPRRDISSTVLTTQVAAAADVVVSCLCICVVRPPFELILTIKLTSWLFAAGS